MASRSTFGRAALVALASACLSAHLRAQDPRGELLGMVLSTSSRPVADASVTYYPDRAAGEHGIEWLGGLTPAPPACAGRTNEKGRYRFTAPRGTGCLLVESASGLGALLRRTSPGAAELVRAVPKGAVRTDDGGPFDADIAALRPPFGQTYLGRRSGHRIELPEGDYLLLLRRGSALAELRCAVRSGQVATVPAPRDEGTVVRIPDGPRVRVTLARWPEVELPHTPDGRVRVPRATGFGLVRAFAAAGDGWAVFEQRYGPEQDEIVLEQPARLSWRTLRLCATDGTRLAAARVFSVVLAGRQPRVRWFGESDADGSARVGLLAGEDGFAVVVDRGFSPVAVPLGAADGEQPVTVPVAGVARLRVTAPDGSPLPGTRVEVEPDDPILRGLLCADARGELAVRRHGSVRIRLEHDSYLPASERVDCGEGESGPQRTLELRPGMELGGIAFLGAGGSDRRASGAVVELRDPTDTVGVSARTVAADHDGAFRFKGLPDSLYTVFAHTEVGGVTWSGKLAAQPGPTEWRLELRCEDPPLPRRHR